MHSIWIKFVDEFVKRASMFSPRKFQTKATKYVRDVCFGQGSCKSEDIKEYISRNPHQNRYLLELSTCKVGISKLLIIKERNFSCSWTTKRFLFVFFNVPGIIH